MNKLSCLLLARYYSPLARILLIISTFSLCIKAGKGIILGGVEKKSVEKKIEKVANCHQSLNF